VKFDREENKVIRGRGWNLRSWIGARKIRSMVFYREYLGMDMRIEWFWIKDIFIFYSKWVFLGGCCWVVFVLLVVFFGWYNV